jgi:16S rRNA (guanine527-N7)-methyltransferase
MSGTEAAAGAALRALEALEAEWRLPAGADQREALLGYADLLLTWSARINLTGARTAVTVVAEHFTDAFALASRLSRPAQVIDVGSGGGLPALPLAILRPELSIDLSEPIAKKAAFLRTAIRTLGLGGRVRVDPRRGEAIADAAPGRFDVATSRATFAPALWLALGRRLVRPGGRVFALAAVDAAPAGLPALVYHGGRRTLVELDVPLGPDVPRETAGPGPHGTAARPDVPRETAGPGPGGTAASRRRRKV